MPLHSPAGTSTPTSTRELASSRSGSTGIPYSGDHWATVNFIPPHPPTETETGVQIAPGTGWCCTSVSETGLSSGFDSLDRAAPGAGTDLEADRHLFSQVLDVGDQAHHPAAGRQLGDDGRDGLERLGVEAAESLV